MDGRIHIVQDLNNYDETGQPVLIAFADRRDALEEANRLRQECRDKRCGDSNKICVVTLGIL